MPGFKRDLGLAKVVLGGVEHGTRVLDLLERDCLAFVKQPLALVVSLRQIKSGPGLVESGCGTDEVVLRLHHVCCLDSEQRLSHRYSVAGLDEQLHHLAGIGRENWGRTVLVNRDLAFGHVLGPEDALSDRLHCAFLAHWGGVGKNKLPFLPVLAISGSRAAIVRILPANMKAAPATPTKIKMIAICVDSESATHRRGVSAGPSII